MWKRALFLSLACLISAIGLSTAPLALAVSGGTASVDGSGTLSFVAAPFVGYSGHLEMYSPDNPNTVDVRWSAPYNASSPSDYNPITAGPGCVEVADFPAPYDNQGSIGPNPAYTDLICSGVSSVDIDLSNATSTFVDLTDTRISVNAPLSSLLAASITPSPAPTTVSPPSNAVVHGSSGTVLTNVGPNTFRNPLNNQIVFSFTPSNVDIQGGTGTNGVDLGSLTADSSDELSVTLDNVANDGLPSQGINVHSNVNEVIGSSSATDPSVNRGTSSVLDLSGATGPVMLSATGLLDFDGVQFFHTSIIGSDFADTISLRGSGTINGGGGDDNIVAGNLLNQCNVTPVVTAHGGSGNDSIFAMGGGGGNINAGYGGGGNIAEYGDEGDDSLSESDIGVAFCAPSAANRGPQTVVTEDGGDGNDTLLPNAYFGSTPAEKISHAYLLKGGADNDQIQFSAGQLTIMPGTGSDFVYPSATTALTDGTRLLSYSDVSEPLTVVASGNPIAPAISGPTTSDVIGNPGAGTSALSFINRLTTGSGSDTIDLSGFDNVTQLNTGPGNDDVTSRVFSAPTNVDCGNGSDDASQTYISNNLTNCEIASARPFALLSTVSGPADGAVLNTPSAQFDLLSYTADGSDYSGFGNTVPYLSQNYGSFTSECSFDGQDFSGGACSSQTFGSLADGQHVYSARTVYLNGLNPAATYLGTTETRTFTVDTAAPVTSIDDLQATINGPQGNSVLVTYSSSEPGSTFQCALDNQPFVPCAPSGITYSFLTLGVHVFKVQATDPAGNTDPNAATRSLDLEGPSTPSEPVVPTSRSPRDPPLAFILNTPPPITTSPNAVFGFGGNNVDRYRCLLDDQGWTACDSATGISYSNLLPGYHEFQLQGFQNDGTASPITNHYWTVNGPQSCVLKSARGRAFVYEHQSRIRFVLPYKTYRQANQVKGTLYMVSANGSRTQLATATVDFHKTGVFRVIKSLPKALMKQVRKAKDFEVRLSIPGTAASCARYLKQQLTIPRSGPGYKVFFPSDSVFAPK